MCSRCSVKAAHRAPARSGRHPRSPDAMGGREDVVAGDQGATACVPPRVVLEVLEGDLEERTRVSPQGPPPHPVSTHLPPLPQHLPARASCGAGHCLLPPPGSLGWAGRWGPRSWRLGETGEEEHSEGAGTTLGRGQEEFWGRHGFRVCCVTLGSRLVLWASASLSVKWEEQHQLGVFFLRMELDKATRAIHGRPGAEGALPALKEGRGGWCVCECPGAPVSFLLPLSRSQRNGEGGYGVSNESTEFQAVITGS